MPYGAANRRAARDYLDGQRATTRCADCGGRPVEWHHDPPVTNENRRIAHLVALGFPVERIAAEMAQCVPLCRSCHMKRDGRTAALVAARLKRLQ